MKACVWDFDLHFFTASLSDDIGSSILHNTSNPTHAVQQMVGLLK